MRSDDETRVVVARGNTPVATWTLGCSGHPDLGLVDRLARLQLAAQRVGYRVRLWDTCVELAELLGLVGLADVLIEDAPSGGQVRGEPEDPEQPGVEEVVMPDDPVA